MGENGKKSRPRRTNANVISQVFFPSPQFVRPFICGVAAAAAKGGN
jgi:hypothetical protein